MNIAAVLTGQASDRPHTAAIVEPRRGLTRSISFADLDRRSAQAAGALSSAGVAPGDGVLVLVPMSIELYVAMIGVFRAGAVAMFLDPSAGLNHIARCCSIFPPAAMIASAKAHALRLVSPALRRIPRQFGVGIAVPGTMRWIDAVASSAATEMVERNDDAGALVTFTSGSTGEPKAAMRSHGFLAAQHAAVAQAINLKPGEIDLATLPIFSLANLASGVTTLIPDADLRRPGAVDTPAVVRQISQQRPTRAVASPAFFERLLDGGASSFPSFRQVFTGGGPVFPDLLDRMGRAMPNARVVALYGSTEAEPIAHLAADEITADDRVAMAGGAGLLAGRPVKEIDLRVITHCWGQPIAPLTPEQFDAMTARVNEPGEIVVHGRHVLTGYVGGRGEAETKFHVADQTWHRTGDAGRLDPADRLWLLGRAEARISDGWGVIYPFAVECAAREIEGIRRCALVAHQEKRVLVVEPRAHSPELATMIGRKLDWAQLDEIITDLPLPFDKRHNAKIDYPALRKSLSSRSGGRSLWR